MRPLKAGIGMLSMNGQSLRTPTAWSGRSVAVVPVPQTLSKCAEEETSRVFGRNFNIKEGTPKKIKKTTQR